MLVIGKGRERRPSDEPPTRIGSSVGLPSMTSVDWNFVSSSQERLEQAKRDWKNGRFPAVPGDDRALIPLSE